MQEKKIGIIGYGNMGRAFADQLKTRYKILVFDIDKDKVKELRDIEYKDNLLDLVRSADVLLLAVKPQDISVVLEQMKLEVDRKLVISIAAGISLRYIEGILGQVALVRAMPNLGIKIGQSFTVFSRGTYATEKDISLAIELLGCCGITKEIQEDMINAYTAISGSGPAYLYYELEKNSITQEIDQIDKDIYLNKFFSASQAIGFEREEAIFLAEQITKISFALLKKTGLSPFQLRALITSKGGTTEAAIGVLSKGGSWEEAAKAAKRRAEELAKKE